METTKEVVEQLAETEHKEISKPTDVPEVPEVEPANETVEENVKPKKSKPLVYDPEKCFIPSSKLQPMIFEPASPTTSSHDISLGDSGISSGDMSSQSSSSQNSPTAKPTNDIDQFETSLPYAHLQSTPASVRTRVPRHTRPSTAAGQDASHFEGDQSVASVRQKTATSGRRSVPAQSVVSSTKQTSANSETWYKPCNGASEAIKQAKSFSKDDDLGDLELVGIEIPFLVVDAESDTKKMEYYWFPHAQKFKIDRLKEKSVLFDQLSPRMDTGDSNALWVPAVLDGTGNFTYLLTQPDVQSASMVPAAVTYQPAYKLHTQQSVAAAAALAH